MTTLLHSFFNNPKQSLLAICGIVILSSCNSTHEEKVSEIEAVVASPQFSITVTQDAAFTGLPDLQSFVFGSSQNNWLMFSGRRNGFHGFANDQDFPVKKANNMLFTYNILNFKLDSMAIPTYGGDTGNVFLCTNLAHTQKDGYLYACGGYGLQNKTDESAKKTYSYFMRIKLDDAINAIKTKNASAFKQAINWGSSELVRSTGGELYILPDGNFYMALGHNFSGTYDGTNSTQVYLDKINVFSLKVNGFNGVNNLALIPVGTISDNMPDSTTEFRRRDLVIAPSILADGLDVGLAVYGGVFKYATGGIQNNGTPFNHPIYIDNKQSHAYRVDSFYQWTNIYSTAFISHYDPTSKSMMTTLLGGLGDSEANFASANWTSVISTNVRSFANHGDVTTSLTNANALPGFIGAEGLFIPAPNVVYYNEAYKIIDYSKLTNNQTVGYIYGGISSNNSGATITATTVASNVVYKVTITK